MKSGLALRTGALPSSVAVVVLLLISGCGESADPSRTQAAPADDQTRLYLAGHASGNREATMEIGGETETVPVSSGFVRVVDPATGASRTVELPGLGGDATYWLTARGDRLVYWTGDAVYSTDLELEGPAVKLGEASSFLTFIPSAEPDRLWLIEHGGGSIRSVREVTTQGRTTVPAVRPLDGRWPAAALTDGLVFPFEGGDRVWNPTTEETVFQLPEGVTLATHGDLLASCVFPADGFMITDVASGEQRTIASPAGLGRFECGPGAFSPDGNQLVVAILPPGFEPGVEWRFALIDVEDGTATEIAGATVAGTRGGPGYVDIAWAPASDAVYIGEGNGGILDLRGGVFEYRLGADEATRLAVETDFQRMAAG